MPKKTLIRRAAEYADSMLAHGTTTAEVKSGYGLTLRDEIKMLEVVRDLRKRHPITLVPTFLGAHTVPAEYRACRGDYVDLLVERILPEVCERGLAECGAPPRLVRGGCQGLCGLVTRILSEARTVGSPNRET